MLDRLEVEKSLGEEDDRAKSGGDGFQREMEVVKVDGREKVETER